MVKYLTLPYAVRSLPSTLHYSTLLRLTQLTGLKLDRADPKCVLLHVALEDHEITFRQLEFE